MDKGLTDSELLAVFNRLPDLLAMAWERKVAPGENVYGIQDELREEHRRRGEPFRWSMPYRGLYHCTECDHASTVVLHELENPRLKDTSSPLHLVKLYDEDVHYIREHGGSFSEECRAFLERVALQDG